MCVERGPAGWWLVGALFTGTGALMPAAVRWAERTRTGAGELADTRVTSADGPATPR
ncbi:hypothetical protein ACFWMJ_29690 [Streptomyces hawaiiensis]|uniref:hypothetical protein n=1 Tax=Streptomyces hawaiiensis TaxID=67305 RepID=UPI0036605FDA